ncbi:hypothetical protein CBR_g66644 [Chara braunii]|uniref:Chromate transporter n=1 Tax=Chara braunii TaxID=69332 RepID=A0A388JPY8_CHABU|nr:hypothetical protein CBR_g66644 [Chara braunii]|eukprot:GBG59841.1 hypothetical protein CBR_g66644 [Chara braunii]
MDMEIDQDERRRDGMELLDSDDVEDAVFDLPTSSLTSAKPLRDIFASFFLLGFRAFGGSNTHVKLLHSQFVEKKRWLDENRFRELMGFGHGMPGPTTVQMVLALGALRGGFSGALLAAFLYVWPGLLVMSAAGILINHASNAGKQELPSWFYEVMVGLAPAAVAHVAYVGFRHAYRFCTDNLRSGLAVLSTIAVLLVTSRVAPWAFPLIIFSGGVVTLLDAMFNSDCPEHRYPSPRLRGGGGMNGAQGMFYAIGVNRKTSVVLILIWLGLVGVVTILRFTIFQSGVIRIMDIFLRMSSISYGGEYVILPIINMEVVHANLIPGLYYMTGIGLAQLVPGHFYNISAFLGAIHAGFLGALAAWIGAFLPSVLLVFAFLSFWDNARQSKLVIATLVGINGMATGMIMAAAGLLLVQTVPSSGPLCVVFAAGACLVVFQVGDRSQRIRCLEWAHRRSSQLGHRVDEVVKLDGLMVGVSGLDRIAKVSAGRLGRETRNSCETGILQLQTWGSATKRSNARTLLRREET